MYVYRVCMTTPLGVRSGTLCLSALSGTLHGTLSLLGKAVPIAGKADQVGNCRLTGELITLVQTIPFTADGTLTRREISLLLHSAQGKFELTGTGLAEKAEP